MNEKTIFETVKLQNNIDHLETFLKKIKNKEIHSIVIFTNEGRETPNGLGCAQLDANLFYSPALMVNLIERVSRELHDAKEHMRMIIEETQNKY